MSWEHKTAPTIIIGTKKELAPLRKNDRRGPHAQLPFTSKEAPVKEIVANKPVDLDKLRQQVNGRETDPVALEALPGKGARCHPDRPRVGPTGHCLECALEYYRKRL